MKYVIDRIEDGIATLLTFDDKEESMNIPFDKLYEGAKEGDVTEENGDGFVYLEAETKKRSDDISARFKRLAKRRSDR